MENSKGTSPKGSAKNVIAVVVALVGIGGGVAAYICAKNAPRGQDMPPAIPQATVTEHENEVEEARIFKRIGELVVSEEEQVIIEKLRALHIAEFEAYKRQSDSKVLAELTDDLKKAASSYAMLDLNRYLELGDHLAYDFNKKLSVVLTKAKASRNLLATIDGGGPEVESLVKASGAYVYHALKTGVLTEDGSFSRARILPMVQFRIRWRGLGGAPLDEKISDIDRKVHFNFVISNPISPSVNKRLAAAYQLAQVDKAFNRPLAEAIILNDAGKTAQAIETLEKAIESGGNDVTSTAFVEYLRKNR